MKHSLAIVVLAIAIISQSLQAQIPRTISYSGVLTDSIGTPKPDGLYVTTFRLYSDSTSGAPLWTEIKYVQVRRGLFSTQLGDETPFPSQTFSAGRWLSIKFGLDPELSPRVRLAAVPYSFSAQRADTALFSYNATGGGSAWKQSGSSIYFAGGNVGIGVAQPATPLHVRGAGDAVVYAQDTSSSSETFGVVGETISNTGTGVYGVANATSGLTVGVIGEASSTDGTGVFGGAGATSGDAWGVWGFSNSTDGIGVRGFAAAATGVTIGVHGGVMSSSGWAGYFDGDLGVTGAKLFQIDHPLDPANRFLNHFCAEGPEPFLIYRGKAVLDQKGEAVVTLPAYFDAINTDAEYQLTCVGGYAPVYVAQEVVNNAFVIAGGTPGLKVCWMITGVRNDPYTREHTIPVEPMKHPEQRGKYLHPEAYGKPANAAIHYVPGGRYSPALDQSTKRDQSR
jgi:hypothetical protein